MRFFIILYLFAGTNLPPVLCQDGSVRLRNGYLDTEGRVEICINRAWGTVCGFGFGQADASVVCRQLGYYPVGKPMAWLLPCR